jgi:hypothetical protein
MFRSTFIRFFIVPSFLPFIFCTQPTDVQYGSISGKVIHPDNNLLIRVISQVRVDTVTRNPITQMFSADRIKYGKCILQVRAEGYGLFEQMIWLDKPQFKCQDIVLADIPQQISFIYPANSQRLDSLYYSFRSPSISDTGFWVFVNFNNLMDSASVKNALTVSPDMGGVHTDWDLDRSLSIYFPYSKLSTIDTVKVTVSRKAKNKEWGDTLDHDCTVFYPIDTAFVRSLLVNKQ